MSDITGGPWTIYDRSDALRVKIKGIRPKTGGAHVATVLGEDNARLIAAALDLLAALEEIVGAAEHCGDGDAPVVIKARAAIDKAIRP